MEMPLSVFKYACVAMAAFMIVFSAPTFAQDLETENRLRRLENEISTLSQSVYRGNPRRQTHIPERATRRRRRGWKCVCNSLRQSCVL